jgi:ribose-phosphate pyrophosphokinase
VEQKIFYGIINFVGEIQMENDLGLIVLNSFKNRGKEVNNFIAELKNEPYSNYIIDVQNPRFSNGESKVILNQSVRGKDVFILADIGNYSNTYKLYGYENHMSPDENYLDIIRTISAIGGKANRITLIMPLMYSSRQHRRTSRESLDCAMALRYLESLGVNNIITFDVHDPDIQNTIPTGSFDTIFPIYSILKKFIANEHEHIGKDKMIAISPDTGAMDRVRKYAGILNLDIGLFYKRRDYTKIENGKNPIIQHEYIGPDVKDKNILIVDDMLSSGESIIDIAYEMKSRGCKNIYIITTFAFFTDGIQKFNELYEKGMISKVYSTDACYLKDDVVNAEWFCKVSLTKFIAKIINALNNNESISEIIQPTAKLQKLLSTFADKLN